MTKRIRRRLSIASSSSVTNNAPNRRDHSNKNEYGDTVPENNSEGRGFMSTMFGSGSIDESESVDVEEISVARNQSRSDSLRRRRKFPSPIPDLGDDNKGFLRKLATVPLKTTASYLDTVGFNTHRGDKSSAEQAPQLNQKVAVSDIEKLAQKSGKNSAQERFRVKPDYAYPRVKFNREELRKEANKKSSYFHDLRGQPQNPALLGSFYLEILQCFGIPRFGDNILRETSAFCLAVCGSSAFQTDVMPPVANPMWLSKMRRACIFPLYEGYATVYVGCFAHQNVKDLFIGRIAVDVAKLRQGCTYDITLPLRKSGVIYSKEQRGAMRVRFHLDWKNERKVLLSYLPKEKPSFRPLDRVTVKCVDNKAFQNVARVVHGQDIPLKFSMKLVKATMRELDFVQIHLLRYTKKRTIRNLRRWETPLISCFVFCAWMHATYHATLRYVPGHIITFVMLHLAKNYTQFVLDGNYDNGFTSPTWEEMVMALAMGDDNRKIIEPLEMERKDPNKVQSAMTLLDDDHDNGQEVPLQTIASALREGVKSHEHKTLFGNLVTTFVGTDAVDFLVENEYASTRQEAVALGVQLEKHCRIFEHKKRKFPFKDADLTYVFLNFDTSEYAFKTHKPWFKRWMRILGFKRVNITPEEAHMEMPFATGKDHPRLTVKDSLVIRSKESRSMLQKENEMGDEDDIHDFGITKYRKTVETANRIPGSQLPGQITNQVLSGIAGTPKAKALPRLSILNAPDEAALAAQLNVETYQDHRTSSLIFSTWDTEDDGTSVTVKQLGKPPNQDINFEKKDDKKIPDAMAEIRREIHDKIGNVFNVQPYRLSLDGAEWGENSTKKNKKLRRSLTPPRMTLGKSSKSSETRRPNLYGASSAKSHKTSKRALTRMTNLTKVRGTKSLDVHGLESLARRKEEYDRMLQLLKHSHSNVIISKIAAILAPMVDVAQMVLSGFRFSFNLMTWRDPVLTFWFVLFGCGLIVFLHLFPWRLCLGLAGIVFVGPQNWVIRIRKEKKEGKEVFDDDKQITKRRPDRSSHPTEDAPFFSSLAPDNRVIRDSQFDTSQYKEIAVPTTPLCFRRFYDWPPEPEYARVSKCAPPENDPTAQQLLEDDSFEVYEGDCEYDDESVVSENRGKYWGRQARKLAKKSIPKKARKIAKRVTSKKLEPVDELDSL
ncbi:unnamed protein product [Cylindrotheca closterium]|uniref:DEP domain-containing protein n=1 Tax=Cylindrotheca closterium TaxID=2856 RepID=A0AAD2JH63_9STRA|nr:unnamed protein product [Cylindrotheca closterium]